MERWLCIHGHFYQPPRENPWLEEVELQDSAYPYHDWNQRITAECYAPMAASRILDDEDRIVRIVDNYSRISFDFGATLLSWLERHAPDTYRAILAADRESLGRFDGHGSALAQAHGHLILPLCNGRDKKTQVRWGVRDFEFRFGRRPEGMWLPETAVDLASLECLAEEGIRFTILAPRQAARVRRIGARTWEDVSGERIDPTRAYELVLPSGRAIAVFFYDGPVSRAVAFERLLARGEHFAGRLLGLFSDGRDHAQLAHVATDGETYGHHHRYGEMALAWALALIEERGGARLTSYGAFLARNPPTHRVEILENTSWSCEHGVERWRADCGCHTGAHPSWNQAWRAPLREALDLLRDAVGPEWERAAGEVLRDPWGARDDYVEVLLDRGERTREAFLARHAIGTPDAAARVRIWKLLELQRHAMMMYTSCGWFFDDLAGIEATQVLFYAARALQLARETLGRDLSGPFLERLGRAKSNVPERGDGRRIWAETVEPAVIDLEKFGAHVAISLMFEGDEAAAHGCRVELEQERRLGSGPARMAVGSMRVTAEVTEESARLGFAVLHFGDHNVSCGIRRHAGDEAHARMVSDLSGAMRAADLTAAVRLLDRHFPATYALNSLFRDKQRRAIDILVRERLEDATATARQVWEANAGLMRFLAELGIPQPEPLCSAARQVIQADLRDELDHDGADTGHVRALLDEARRLGIDLDTAGLGLGFQRLLEARMARLLEEPHDPERLDAAVELAELIRDLRFEVDLWRVQNGLYGLLEHHHAGTLRRAAESGRTGEAARAWLARVERLAAALHIRIDGPRRA